MARNDAVFLIVKYFTLIYRLFSGLITGPFMVHSTERGKQTYSKMDMSNAGNNINVDLQE